MWQRVLIAVVVIGSALGMIPAGILPGGYGMTPGGLLILMIMGRIAVTVVRAAGDRRGARPVRRGAVPAGSG